jgi:hypothetical protein
MAAAGGEKVTKRPIRFRALDRARVFPPSLVDTTLQRIATNFLRYAEDYEQKEFYKKAPAALAGGSEVSGAMNNMLNAKEPIGFDSDTTRKYERYERMLIHRLKPAQMKVVYELLDLNMNIVEAATRIHDEDYWKRRMLATRANCQVRDYGMSWKQAFLESDLARRLEEHPTSAQLREMENAAKKLNEQAANNRKDWVDREFLQKGQPKGTPGHPDGTPDIPALSPQERNKLFEEAAKMEKEAAKKQAFVDQHRDIAGLKLQVQASHGHIFQLKLNTLPSHVDISFVFDGCPALCCIELTYGHKRLGMNYERAEFGMKISDAQVLARNFCVCQTLVSVSLQCNMIDDELVKILVHGLQYAHMVTYLDLSHNKICDRGARRLASLLDPEYAYHTLKLADNQIHANGCMHLGAHLADNYTLQHLDLRLNRCEDNGVSHLFHDLCVNKYLKTLNLSCNDLTQRSLPYLSSMLNDNRTLEELDLSANPLYMSPEPEENPAGEEEAAAEPTMSGVPLTLAGLEELNIERDSPVGIMIMCVNSNPTIIKLDIRRCSFPPEIEEVLTTMVKHKELRKRKIPVEAYERKRQPKEEEEVVEDVEGEEGEELAEGAEGAEGEAGEGDQAEEGEGGEELA